LTFRFSSFHDPTPLAQIGETLSGKVPVAHLYEGEFRTSNPDFAKFDAAIWKFVSEIGKGETPGHKQDGRR
jgi:hypothetical protein